MLLNPTPTNTPLRCQPTLIGTTPAMQPQVLLNTHRKLHHMVAVVAHLSTHNHPPQRHHSCKTAAVHLITVATIKAIIRHRAPIPSTRVSRTFISIPETIHALQSVHFVSSSSVCIDPRNHPRNDMLYVQFLSGKIPSSTIVGVLFTNVCHTTDFCV